MGRKYDYLRILSKFYIVDINLQAKNKSWNYFVIPKVAYTFAVHKEP